MLTKLNIFINMININNLKHIKAITKIIFKNYICIHNL